jgi:hypothetical protein
VPVLGSAAPISSANGTLGEAEPSGAHLRLVTDD